MFHLLWQEMREMNVRRFNNLARTKQTTKSDASDA